MTPELSGSHVYFERDLHLSSTGTVLSRAKLVAMDRETGAEMWAQPIVSGENAAVAGNVIGAVWGSLPMFDRVTGASLPVFRYGEMSLSGNVASDGERFYVLTHNGHALAVNPARGTAQWDANLAGSGASVGFGVGVAGDAVAATLKHFGSAAAPGDSGLASCEGMVIAPTGDLAIVALDAATGAARWRVNAEDLGSLSSLDCSYGTVLARGSRLAVLDARSGARRARYPIRDPDDGRREFMIAAVTRDADFLYISTTYGYAKVDAPAR
jgi:outer membrane protein assembly factor BamB